MNEKIEILSSKSKTILLTLGSAVFVAIGYYMFQKTGNYIGIISVLFFGATGIFGLIKLFEKNTGIKIDKYGIHDYSNASSIGLIEWKDIIGLGTTEVSSQSFIMIYVNNPEKYIEKCNNIIKKRFLKMNLKLYGTPFYITPVSLKYNFKNLEELIQSEFEKQKKLRINNPRL